VKYRQTEYDVGDSNAHDKYMHEHDDDIGHVSKLHARPVEDGQAYQESIPGQPQLSTKESQGENRPFLIASDNKDALVAAELRERIQQLVADNEQLKETNEQKRAASE